MNDKFIKEVLKLFLIWILNNPKIFKNESIENTVNEFLKTSKLKIKE